VAGVAGSVGHVFYLIKSGEVGVFKQEADADAAGGEEIKISRLGPGQFFGEVGGAQRRCCVCMHVVTCGLWLVLSSCVTLCHNVCSKHCYTMVGVSRRFGRSAPCSASVYTRSSSNCFSSR
jgi:CRP-like cAMP-binding protein